MKRRSLVKLAAVVLIIGGLITLDTLFGPRGIRTLRSQMSAGQSIRYLASEDWHAGDHDGAMQRLRVAITSPADAHEHARLLRQLGQYAMWRKDHAEAGKCFASFRAMANASPDLITAMPSQYVQVMYNLAQVAVTGSDLPSALEILEEALARQPADIGEDAYLRLSFLYASVQSTENAIDRGINQLKAARAHAPNAWQAHVFRNEAVLFRYAQPAGTDTDDTLHVLRLWSTAAAQVDPDAAYLGMAIIDRYFQNDRGPDAMDVAMEFALRADTWLNTLNARTPVASAFDEAYLRAWKQQHFTVLSLLQGAASHQRPEYANFAEATLAQLLPDQPLLTIPRP